jgi:hypothetical protein
VAIVGKHLDCPRLANGVEELEEDATKNYSELHH